METSPAKVGPPAANVVESEVDGNINLYDPQTEEVAILNETASDVWRLADGTQTLDQVVALIARAYGVEPQQIEEEVKATVATFVDKGLFSADRES